MLIRKSRRTYIVATLLLLAIEIIIALYINDDFIRPYLGDLFASMVMYGLLMSVSRLSVRNGITLALLISYAVEFLQYIQIVDKLDLMGNKIARIMIGTSFSWMDLLMYSLGALSVYFLEKNISCKNAFKH
ncbi:hypothetical protein AAU57_13910 [Nonlabens sp. YIK11]|uniref:ribosomal maturation YjgA family protein n=1 Tax=Nonlabens sp. YIK11 TaxID=1453349 RepID=UPI0006DC7063|nr:DUF2809 domain-containing protein [Nonlabens sp. YIK11]KQC34312.1 hypothetical protein AAU57_13910 [Nonlabens sp. YIK11]